MVTRARLEIKDGLVVKATADEGQAALDTFLASAPGAKHFREFGLGFNPKLVVPAGQTALPYYGYGDAVVRLSLGDNEEVGGAVRGGGVRWLFFPDTTVTVGSHHARQERQAGGSDVAEVGRSRGTAGSSRPSLGHRQSAIGLRIACGVRVPVSLSS